MMRSRRGVTLIEMLIAVSLLSMLSVGILMAMRAGLGAMAKANAKLMADRRSVSVQRIVESEIAGFAAVPAACPVDAQKPPVSVPFFEGLPGTMRFVSRYSLQEAWRGREHVLEFQVIPGDKGQGVRLIVNESLYTGPFSAGCLGMGPGPSPGMTIPVFRPVEPGPGSFVLADKLAYCRFLYRDPAPPPGSERWLPAWTGKPGWPAAVRIEMAQLAPDPARVPLLTMTAPLRVNKQPYEKYAE
jgi:prepilin-type N-terminal cleavage/methylation domain-containing protein